MTEADEILMAEDDAASTSPVLQAAVWMCQDLGITMPPVARVHVPLLQELSLGRLFATQPDLLALSSDTDIAWALGNGPWPASGCAFGYSLRGRRAHWFYTLIGEQRMLHVSLPIRLDDDVALAVMAAAVSRAHDRLSSHFEIDSNYYRAVLAPVPSTELPRVVVTFTEVDGVACEQHHSWTASEGLVLLGVRSEVFAAAEEMSPDQSDTLRLWG